MMILTSSRIIRGLILYSLFVITISGCGFDELGPVERLEDTMEAASTPEISTPENQAEQNTAAPISTQLDKITLWQGESQLRGANIWQRIVVPDLDGTEFLGASHVGPPYTQADFDHLASLGANYVNISGPGLFTEVPPYILDAEVQANLDHLLEMIQKADMFAVITFRTGPGRSDFTFYSEGAGNWFDPELLREWVWEDSTAQEAWVEMWRYTAKRYKNHPVVVGYDLMCEPHPGGIREIYDPEVYFKKYGGTEQDWNQLYPQITTAIREVDTDTPILIGGMNWSSVRWLPYLVPTGDPRTVYIVHQYEPQSEYTHQESRHPEHGYPDRFDLDWDGKKDDFNKEWLNSYLGIIDQFQNDWDVPMAVNEYGIVRWIPGGEDFLADQLDLFETRGLNHAIWMWDPAWEPWTEEVNAMNYRFGQDPKSHEDMIPNPLMDLLEEYWTKNEIRPSDFNPE